MSTLDAEFVYNQNEAATFLRINPRTLEWWRVTGHGPRFLRMGRRDVYRGKALKAFLDDQERRTENGDGAAA